MIKFIALCMIVGLLFILGKWAIGVAFTLLIVGMPIVLFVYAIKTVDDLIYWIIYGSGGKE